MTPDRASVGAAKRTPEGQKPSEERNRGPGRGALGRRPQATTAKELVIGLTRTSYLFDHYVREEHV